MVAKLIFALRSSRLRTVTFLCGLVFVFTTPAVALAQETALPGTSVSAMVTLEATPTPPSQPSIISPSNGLRSASYYYDIKVGISSNTTSVALLINSVSRYQLPTSGPTEIVFSNVKLSEGENCIQAYASNWAGGVYSPVIRITVVDIPGLPQVTSHRVSQVVQSPVSIEGVAGKETLFVECYLNDQYIGRSNIDQSGLFYFGGLPLNYGGNRIDLIARNEFYSTPFTFYLIQLDFEASGQTAIIIDKSDFRIYYIVNGVLECSFPIAIGRVGMSTPSAQWIVGEKHYCNPGGVYGPRKLRLYRLVYTRRYRGRGRRRVLVSSGYYYKRTRYGVHGTNQPWVINTRASHGCIRLYNNDILYLFDRVPIGTAVFTRD